MTLKDEVKKAEDVVEATADAAAPQATGWIKVHPGVVLVLVLVAAVAVACHVVF